MTRKISAFVAIGFACAALALQSAPVAAAGAHAATRGRTPSVALEAFAGDVFQLGSNGSLIAVDPRTASDTAALYNAEGDSLNTTWGQWRAATGSSLAKTIIRPAGTATDLRITVGGLFPNAVYSLFYSTIGPQSVNPVCATEPLVALTARRPARQQPDASSFVTDGSGAASFHARVPGTLLDAQSFIIFVIYHFDGKVYGSLPNAGDSARCRSTFGVDANRQLLIIQK
jgi:hypothetical protein